METKQEIIDKINTLIKDNGGLKSSDFNPLMQSMADKLVDSYKTVGGEDIVGDGDVVLPTKTSDLENDNGFQTALEVQNALPTSSESIKKVGIQYQRSAIGGDVESLQNSNTVVIKNKAVTNSKLADMNTNTLKGNNTTTGTPSDLEVEEVKAMLGVQRWRSVDSVSTIGDKLTLEIAGEFGVIISRYDANNCQVYIKSLTTNKDSVLLRSFTNNINGTLVEFMSVASVTATPTNYLPNSTDKMLDVLGKNVFKGYIIWKRDCYEVTIIIKDSGDFAFMWADKIF